MTRSIEDFLQETHSQYGGLIVVGGSALYSGVNPEPNAISINGFHPECPTAAINSLASDEKRVESFVTVIAPWPKRTMPDHVLLPGGKIEYRKPEGMPKKQPTTYFTLLQICNTLGLSVDVYGICGWATRHHHGDWEMWYMKTQMKHIKIHDPRPRW